MINYFTELVHVNESNIDGDRLIVVPRWKLLLDDWKPFLGAFLVAAACCLLVLMTR